MGGVTLGRRQESRGRGFDRLLTTRSKRRIRSYQRRRRQQRRIITNHEVKKSKETETEVGSWSKKPAACSTCTGC